MTLSLRTRTAFGSPLQSVKLAVIAVRAMAKALANRRKVLAMADLPDYILNDMGLRRNDVSEALSADWRQDPSWALAGRASRRRRGLCD